MGHFIPQWDCEATANDDISMFGSPPCEYGNLPDLDAPVFYSHTQTPPSESRELNNSPPLAGLIKEGNGEAIGAPDTTFIGGAHKHAADRTDMPSQILDLDTSEPLVEEISENKRARVILLGLERLKKTHQISLLDLRRDLRDLVVKGGPHGLCVEPGRKPEVPEPTDDAESILLKQETNKLLLEIIANDIEKNRLHIMVGRPPTAQEIIWKIHQSELLIAQDDFQIFLFNRKQGHPPCNRPTQIGVQAESVQLPGRVAIDEPLPTSAGVPIVQLGAHRISSVVLRPRSGTNLLASWNEGASLVPVSDIHQSSPSSGVTDRSTSRTSTPRSVSPATSAGIHQTVASSHVSGAGTSDPVTITPVSRVQASTSKPISAPQQGSSPSRTLMTVGKYDLPLGVPAEFYVCWELPDQRDLPASANQKRKRTLEETNNFKAVRTIKACLRCRRLKIKCSGMDPCSGCVDVLRRSSKANPSIDLGFTACVRTLMSSNFFLKDGNLPNAGGFPDAGKITVGNLQEAFDFSFRNLFTSNRAPVDSGAIEKLDDLYIKAMVRAFPHQTCVAKIASTLAPSGLNIFIKSNTVLILEFLFPEEVAEVKPYLESLRALSSIYLFEILKDATSPAKLRTANFEQVVNIIIVLALLTEQILDLNERHDPVRWSDEERKLQDWIVTELVGYLRYLILSVFSGKSRVLKFVDLNKRQRLLDNTFWTTFENETLEMVSRQQHGEQTHSGMPLDPVEENDAMLSSCPVQPLRRPEDTRSEEVSEEAMTRTAQHQILLEPQPETLNEIPGVPEPPVQRQGGFSAKADKKSNFGKISTRWPDSIDTAASKVRSIKAAVKAAVKASTANELNGIWGRIQKSRQRREEESRLRRDHRHDLPRGKRILESTFRLRALRALSTRRAPDPWNDVPLRHLNLSAQRSSYHDEDFD